MEIITRTERRRRYSPSERAAVLAEADEPGTTVREVDQRHDFAESLIYHWRTVRRKASSIASELLQFIAYGEVTDAIGDLSVAPSMPTPSVTRRVQAERPLPEDLMRPHPGSRPGSIGIELGTGVRLSVDSYVNEKALARVLRALQEAPCSR
jgi:transposase